MNEINPSRPHISIVVLNYNGQHYLAQTIPPLLQMEYGQYDVTVVDNHSNDESIAYLKSLNDPHLTIIEHTKNFGYGAGKNSGVHAAKGEYILLLDEDILINTPTILAELLELYQRLPHVGFLSLLLREKDDMHRTKFYGGFLHRFSIYSNKPLPIRQLQKQEYHKASGPDGGALFFKKKIFERIGGYDTVQPYYLDVGDLGPRAAIFGFETYVLTKDIGIHLGTIRKTDVEYWLWKYGYNYSGLSRMMFKNYTAKNLWISYPYFCAFCVAKTAVNVIRHKDLRVISRFFFSIRLFFRNLPSTLMERRKIQSERKKRLDDFLFIKPPKPSL